LVNPEFVGQIGLGDGWIDPGQPLAKRHVG
jgi:hypothetical protein